MSKTTWYTSATLVIIFSVFLGIAISQTNLLIPLVTEPETEQIEIANDTWQQEGSTISTLLEYGTPAGPETNTVSFTLDNSNVITAVSLSIDTTDAVSASYQERFTTEVQTLLIGKKITEVTSIDTVAGASLTTKAFNAAVVQL